MYDAIGEGHLLLLEWICSNEILVCYGILLKQTGSEIFTY